MEKNNQLSQSLQPFVQLYNALEEARELIPSIKDCITKREKHLQEQLKLDSEKQKQPLSESEKEESQTSED